MPTIRILPLAEVPEYKRLLEKKRERVHTKPSVIQQIIAQHSQVQPTETYVIQDFAYTSPQWPIVKPSAALHTNPWFISGDGIKFLVCGWKERLTTTQIRHYFDHLSGITRTSSNEAEGWQRAQAWDARFVEILQEAGCNIFWILMDPILLPDHYKRIQQKCPKIQVVIHHNIYYDYTDFEGHIIDDVLKRFELGPALPEQLPPEQLQFLQHRKVQ